MSSRSEFLSPLIGNPWSWQSKNCWDFARHVEAELFGRDLPVVAVPADFSPRWVLEEIRCHDERSRWGEVQDGPGGLVLAADGSLVLMARADYPAHIGVWLAPEQRVIHCDGKTGVACETVLALKQMGWRKLRFFQPKGLACTHP